MGQASNREDLLHLRKHGTVEYRGKPVDVFAAEDISLWIISRLQEAIGGWMLGQRDRLDLSEATIETMLSSARPGLLRRAYAAV